jgi:hypothetical protein
MWQRAQDLLKTGHFQDHLRWFADNPFLARAPAAMESGLHFVAMSPDFRYAPALPLIRIIHGSSISP